MKLPDQANNKVQQIAHRHRILQVKVDNKVIKLNKNKDLQDKVNNRNLPDKANKKVYQMAYTNLVVN